LWLAALKQIPENRTAFWRRARSPLHKGPTETAFARVLALDEAFTRFAGVLSVLPQALELAAPDAR